MAIMVDTDTKAEPFGIPGHVHTVLLPAGGYMELSLGLNASSVPTPDHQGHTIAINGDEYTLGDEQHSEDDDEDTEDIIVKGSNYRL
jgi:hypothetical protein